MKIKFAVLLAFLFVLTFQVPRVHADSAENSAAPVTAAQDEAAPAATSETSATANTSAAKEEAPATPVAPAAAKEEAQAPAHVTAPAPAATQPEVVAPAASNEVVANTSATAAEQGAESNPPAVPSIPNPYTNVTDPEFYLLQDLAVELAADAKTGLDQAEANAHLGRYGEDNYIAMLKSFAEAASTLNDILHKAPIDIRQVHMSIKAMKTLVVDIDDVFVYNPTYLNEIRNWNECKRILRRIDGTVYQEGGLRRVQTIWDSNQFLKDTGKFLNVHGVLGGINDFLHRNNPTGPMDRLVGRHTGCRRVATVWTLPSGTYHSQLTNPRSDMNEAVQQY